MQLVAMADRRTAKAPVSAARKFALVAESAGKQATEPAS